MSLKSHVLTLEVPLGRRIDTSAGCLIPRLAIHLTFNLVGAVGCTVTCKCKVSPG